MKAYFEVAAIGLLIGGAIGCEAPSVSNTPAASSTPVAAQPKEEEKPMVAGAPGEPLPEIETPVTDIPRPVTPDDPIKGRRSKRAGGELGAAAHARFWAEHKLIYDQVKSNLGLYMATTGNLDYPKSNKEFFEKVIKGYGMKLPELEPNHEYCYLPEQPELGLLIRLKPGSPGSKVPAGTTPEEAIKLLGAQLPEGGAAAEAPAAASPTEQPASEEPSPDIRTRAEQLNGAQTGGQTPGLSEKAKEHAVAPGGLAPVGGIE